MKSQIHINQNHEFNQNDFGQSDVGQSRDGSFDISKVRTIWFPFKNSAHYTMAEMTPVLDS